MRVVSYDEDERQFGNGQVDWQDVVGQCRLGDPGNGDHRRSGQFCGNRCYLGLQVFIVKKLSWNFNRSSSAGWNILTG